MGHAYLIMDFCKKNKQYFDRKETDDGEECLFYFKTGAYLQPPTFDKTLIDNFIKENNINAEWDKYTPMLLRVKIEFKPYMCR